MITADQALSYQFQKAGMNGYRSTEVDEFVAAVAETLNFQEKKVRDMQRIIDELKKNETIIQTTLVNAQKLAMQLTDDAKQNAEITTAEAEQRAKELVLAAEQKASELISIAQTTSDGMLSGAQDKARQLVEDAEQNSQQLLDKLRRDAANEEAELNAELERQRLILEALKNEVSAFRNDILNRYKEQVSLIKELPETIPAVAVEPVHVPVAEVETESEDDIPVIDITPIIQDETVTAETAGSDLLKLMDDMAENEAQAEAAVNEVATLTSELNEENTQLTFNKETEQTPPVTLGGFHIMIDDDEEDDDAELSFGGRIQVSDDN